MNRKDWLWMPHPAHFIMSGDCEFHLATYVGHYVVSTVGELVPDEGVREIHAQVRNIKLEGRGDSRLYDFMKKCGYMEIGLNRLYETMVFQAVPRKSKHKCCPWEIDVGKEVDFAGYNDPIEATEGHYKLCDKWSKLGVISNLTP